MLSVDEAVDLVDLGLSIVERVEAGLEPVCTFELLAVNGILEVDAAAVWRLAPEAVLDGLDV